MRRNGRAWRRDMEMYLARRTNKGFAKPDVLSMNLTLRCNLSCSMCTTCYDSPELSLEEIKSVLDQASVWGIEVFNPLGGEPFMRKDIEDIFDYAVRRGFFVSVTTNATLITERRAARLAILSSDRLHINISLDGDRQSNDAIRGEGMWDRAIAGYHHIRHADAQMGHTHRKILANTILHAQNMDRFEDILEEQEALGFDGVQILNLFRMGEERPAQDLWFQPSDLPRLEQLCAQLIRKKRTDSAYQIQNTEEELRNIVPYYRDELKPMDAPCWAGWKELYINADGAAIMCDTKLDFLNGSFGNVREQSIRQLWTSPQLETLRGAVKQCNTPCVQKCYQRGSSDSGTDLLKDGMRLLQETLAGNVPFLGWQRTEGSMLRLELSDVSPSDEETKTPAQERWRQLLQHAPRYPNPQEWTKFRDEGLVDFGRGFMGFELIREILESLYKARISFSRLCLGWRGDPLLHPEIEAILKYCFAMQKKGVFEILRIETTGLFLRESIAKHAQVPQPQEWCIAQDSGQIALLEQYQGHQTRIIITEQLGIISVPMLLQRYPNYMPQIGVDPKDAQKVLLWRPKEELPPEELRTVATQYNIPLSLPASSHCLAPEKSLVVSWDGKITQCTKDIQMRNMLNDDARVVDVWRQRHRFVQEAEQHKTPQRPFCAGCTFFETCSGPNGS